MRMPFTDQVVRSFVKDFIEEHDPPNEPFSLNRVLRHYEGHDLDQQQLNRILNAMVVEGVLAKQNNGNFDVFVFVEPQIEEWEQVALYPWQERAIEAWNANGHRGIVEAVTGTGKTRMALAAWNELRQNVHPLNCLVVVPTIALMNQWYKEIRKLFEGQNVHRLGDGHDQNFDIAPVCVAVINSAVNRIFPRDGRRGLLDHAVNGDTRTLLIADECHRYLYGDRNRRVLDFPFDFTLGISATIEPFQVIGLGQVIHTYDFEAAFNDRLAPAFDVLNVSVPFTDEERQDYNNLSDAIDTAAQQIRNGYPEAQWLHGKDLFNFVKSNLTESDAEPDPLLQRYQVLQFKRSAIAHTAENKLELGGRICSKLLNEGLKKTIVFFERIESADDAYRQLYETKVSEMDQEMNRVQPNWVGVIHSGNTQIENQDVLDEFRNNRVSALMVCRSLDEGLDVPAIDAAVLVASSKSSRQRIQRVGRALRRGDGGKRPMIITLIVPESTDGYVVHDDQELFGAAATIHNCDNQECLEKIQELLAIDN